MDFFRIDLSFWLQLQFSARVALRLPAAPRSLRERTFLVPNPILGVFLHWLGGLASGSFYVPYRRVKHWAWETYWLVGGFFSWIIAPWLLALLLTRDLFAVLRESPLTSLFWAYAFGLLWGLGGLTFGLTMRYLGMSLGMAVALGYTAAFGTLMPPIFRGQFRSEVLGTHSGMIILIGVAICLFGIVFAGTAGMSKEKELSQEQKRLSIKEFDLKRGLLVATFSGVMSACFAYGLAAGDPIKGLTIRHGTPPLWQGLPVLVVVLLGGFTTNFIWCFALNIRNRTGYQYLNSEIRQNLLSGPPLETVTDAPAEVNRRSIRSITRRARDFANRVIQPDGFCQNLVIKYKVVRIGGEGQASQKFCCKRAVARMKFRYFCAEE